MLATRLGAIRGVKAVVLGGSHARGFALAGSDIDLGVLYSETDPFSIPSIRELVSGLNDTPEPVIAGFYEWGAWVNGGAWLTIGGQRVDFLYRCLEHVQRVISEAEAGRYEVDYAQQPPFGFFSGTYLGEVATCIPLFDPDRCVEGLKRQVELYPESLRLALRGDTYGTASCLTRAVNQMVLALFALNRKYLINDKTSLQELASFECVLREFGTRVQAIFANLGRSELGLTSSVEKIEQLFR